MKRVDGFSEYNQILEKMFHFVEREHVCSVALGFCRISVCLQENAVGSYGDCSFCDCGNHGRTSACDSRRLIGLLE